MIIALLRRVDTLIGANALSFTRSTRVNPNFLLEISRKYASLSHARNLKVRYAKMSYFLRYEESRVLPWSLVCAITVVSKIRRFRLSKKSITVSKRFSTFTAQNSRRVLDFRNAKPTLPMHAISVVWQKKTRKGIRAGRKYLATQRPHLRYNRLYDA